MSSVLTNKFRIHNAKSFVEGFSEAVPTNIYTAIGKVTPWSATDTYSGAGSSTSESNPPTPLDHIQNENEVWRNMIAAKKIKTNDVVHSIPRVNWESNKIYTMYSDTDATLLVNVINSSTPKPFYVLTDEFNVYKCLFNNNEGESTIKPTGNGSSLIKPTDGYIWKYMYTVSPSDAFRFMTENFIPIQTLESDPGSGSSCASPNLQWNVQTNAIAGAIDVIARRIGSSNNGAGSGYVSATGTVSTVALQGSDTSIIINGTLGVGSSYYNNLTLYYPSKGTAFTITSFTQNSGGNDEIVVSGDATSGVVAGSEPFQILPTVNITGDGSGAKAIAVMGSANTLTNANQIDSIKVLSGGSGYTKASVTFTNATGVTTTDAVFDVIIPPQGGHGKDAVEELGGFFVMVNTKLEYDEPAFPTKVLTTQNDYRQISLIRQPKVSASGNADATADLYLQTQVLTVASSAITNTFLPDEVVTQSSTNATGIVVDVLTDGNNKLIRIINVSGTFNTTDSISSSGTASATSISSITVPELLSNSGDVMFVEQRSGIVRDQSQIEDIKIILEF